MALSEMRSKYFELHGMARASSFSKRSSSSLSFEISDPTPGHDSLNYDRGFTATPMFRSCLSKIFVIAIVAIGTIDSIDGLGA